MTIKKYEAVYAPEVAAIYNHHVRETTVSFETADVTPAEMSARLEAIASGYPCIVCVDEATGRLAGYAYAHKWKEKAAYDTTAETTVYVAEGFHRSGVGLMLMERLIADCREAGLHVLIACITADNEASCRFHEKLGFEKVSEFRQVGRKFDRWLDVADYELIL
ncbi:MAG: GNAT family N-acetyltransferase [Paramuribaculum sp.]|nr:GNAT family N-acetyltransferase [Paramuribaculum sp.]